MSQVSFPSPRHNHQRCIQQALNSAEQLCSQRSARLTPLRRRVLELIWQSHKPLGAYELLGFLQEEELGSAPPTVYRALDFLLAQGLIHRLASLNAFIGCNQPGEAHSGYFFICSDCGVALEIDNSAIGAEIDAQAQALGFRINEQMLEVRGQCERCYRA